MLLLPPAACLAAGELELGRAAWCVPSPPEELRRTLLLG
jgi:hypothetical protein